MKELGTNFLIECDCGNRWDLDLEPTPEVCQGEIWKLGLNDESLGRIVWGPRVDAEGRPVT